jgi:hypothetical protein
MNTLGILPERRSMAKIEPKTAKTIKEYRTAYKGYDIVVPVGSTVSSMTASGIDYEYRFWSDFHEYAEKLTGVKDSLLQHDLTYYGLNIPAEYCEPYEHLPDP